MRNRNDKSAGLALLAVVVLIALAALIDNWRANQWAAAMARHGVGTQAVPK